MKSSSALMLQSLDTAYAANHTPKYNNTYTHITLSMGKKYPSTYSTALMHVS